MDEMSKQMTEELTGTSYSGVGSNASVAGLPQLWLVGPSSLTVVVLFYWRHDVQANLTRRAICQSSWTNESSQPCRTFAVR